MKLDGNIRMNSMSFLAYEMDKCKKDSRPVAFALIIFDLSCPKPARKANALRLSYCAWCMLCFTFCTLGSCPSSCSWTCGKQRSPSLSGFFFAFNRDRRLVPTSLKGVKQFDAKALHLFKPQMRSDEKTFITKVRTAILQMLHPRFLILQTSGKQLSFCFWTHANLVSQCLEFTPFLTGTGPKLSVFVL